MFVVTGRYGLDGTSASSRLQIRTHAKATLPAPRLKLHLQQHCEPHARGVSAQQSGRLACEPTLVA